MSLLCQSFTRDRTIAYFEKDFLSHGEKRKLRNSLSEEPELPVARNSWLRLSSFGKIPPWATSTTISSSTTFIASKTSSQLYD
ncbi:hypothetical protein RB195_017540 [Necator americanus]|uniref:Uncharacterized protein n=1 Tax=Necator americanus TaxID=51031 RepID=A0ABR1C5P7_NECAM